MPRYAASLLALFAFCAMADDGLAAAQSSLIVPAVPTSRTSGELLPESNIEIGTPNLPIDAKLLDKTTHEAQLFFAAVANGTLDPATLTNTLVLITHDDSPNPQYAGQPLVSDIRASGLAKRLRSCTMSPAESLMLPKKAPHALIRVTCADAPTNESIFAVYDLAEDSPRLIAVTIGKPIAVYVDIDNNAYLKSKYSKQLPAKTSLRRP